jgi:L-iditol 2-dehydrogenase
LPERNVFVVPETLPLEHVALIEPSTVARHMLALGNFEAGQTATVLGAGSIGLMIVQWLRILGASEIICTDISQSNLEIAMRLGATVTLNPREVDIVSEIRNRTGDGVDLTLEATGVPAALEQTIPITRPRGKVVLGGNQPQDKSLPLTFIEEMMRRELALIGCFMSYSAPFPGHEWHDTITALLDGSLDMEAMISHRIGLSETPDVFARVGSHRMPHLKIMLDPES